MNLECLDEDKMKELEKIIGASKKELYSLVSVELVPKVARPSYVELSFNYFLSGIKTGSSSGRIHSENPEYIGDIWQGHEKNIFVPEHYNPARLIKQTVVIRGMGAIFLSCHFEALFDFNNSIKDYLMVPNALTDRGSIFYERLGLSSDLMLQGEYSCADVADKVKQYASKHNFKTNL